MPADQQENGHGPRTIWHLPMQRLTPAERRVAIMATEGLSYKIIARNLGKSPATVRNQLHAVYQKLGVANRTALAYKLRAPPP